MPEQQTAKAANAALKAVADPVIAEHSQRFFKTGPGEYGEGDVFYGVRVPDIRKIAKRFKHLPLGEIETLLYSAIHEVRLLSLVILVEQYEHGDEETKKRIFAFYKRHAAQVNNWDLVDTSAPKIIGVHLYGRNRTQLKTWAKANSLWKRRIAIVSTLFFIQKGDLNDTLKICEALLQDEHDLIHKACGWMLREAGKRDQKTLERFLDEHVTAMPRTMLRYAIEKLPEAKRRGYLYKR